MNNDTDCLEAPVTGEEWLTLVASATVGQRGTVTLPVELRKFLNIKQGQRLLVFAMGNQHALVLMPFDHVYEHLLDGTAQVQR